MATTVTNRMMDNLSCMLRAKDELIHAHLQARAAAPHAGPQQAYAPTHQENMEDSSELAKENSQLKIQLLEAAADNDAISRSLQERMVSLTDITDAKYKAESEAKVLQVQIKSLQKDMDAYKYELHLLRKQLQIRNGEREQNRKESDASHRQHLDNVKKIARLESDCQRLRSLIRQRLAGPAAMAQMRAICEMHVTIGGTKKTSGRPITPSKILTSSSIFHHQRETEALTERLLSVEDEAKFLKEALAKKTAELQDARQFCARMAMKLSSAQDLMETMSTVSALQTPQTERHMRAIDCNYAQIQEQDSSTYADHAVEDGLVNESSCMPRERVVSMDLEEDGSFNCREMDELSCAESWASALFAELSHLSNLQETVSVVGSDNVSISAILKGKEEFGGAGGAEADTLADLQELDFHSALQKVGQKLSHVGQSILLSSFTSSSDGLVHHTNDMKGDPATSVLLCTESVEISRTEQKMEQNFNVVDEISQIKHLLLELARVMQIQGKSSNPSVNVITADNHDQVIGNEDAKLIPTSKRDRIPESVQSEPKCSDGATISPKATVAMKESGDEIIYCCAEAANFGGNHGASTGEVDEWAVKFGGIASTARENVEVPQAINLRSCAAGPKSSDGTMNNSAKSNDHATYSGTSTKFISADTGSSSKLEGDDVIVAPEATDVDGQVDLALLLRAARADLELSRGRIALLEGELSRVLGEKADVVQELSHTWSLKNKVEAELGRSRANVEELKVEISTLKSQLADQALIRGSSPPSCKQVDTQPTKLLNMEEDQEIASASAQVTDCPRSKNAMHKQMAHSITVSVPQDLIANDGLFFDSFSQSSKSTNSNCRNSTSPTMNQQASKSSPKASNTNPTEHTGMSPLQQEANPLHTNTLQENKICHYSTEDAHILGKINANRVQEVSISCDSLSKSAKGKSCEMKVVKPPKMATSSRIAKFFRRAKSSKSIKA